MVNQEIIHCLSFVAHRPWVQYPKEEMVGCLKGSLMGFGIHWLFPEFFKDHSLSLFQLLSGCLTNFHTEPSFLRL